jgi:hypothetical protein
MMRIGAIGVYRGAVGWYAQCGYRRAAWAVCAQCDNRRATLRETVVTTEGVCLLALLHLFSKPEVR